jgi:DNA-binding MarR family transcriptional regulator
VVEETGEVVTLQMSSRVGRRKKGKKKMFALVDLEALAELELSAAEWRVLRRLMRHVNPETNQANVSLAELGEAVGMAAPNTSAIMRRLRARRIVFTLRRGTHRVNAHIMYRGSNADWDIATDTEPEPIWRRA